MENNQVETVVFNKAEYEEMVRIINELKEEKAKKEFEELKKKVIRALNMNYLIGSCYKKEYYRHHIKENKIITFISESGYADAFDKLLNEGIPFGIITLIIKNELEEWEESDRRDAEEEAEASDRAIENSLGQSNDPVEE